MRQIGLDLWPGGLTHAITFSYDDGQSYDRQVIDILNENGLKGTFHLNSGYLDQDGFVRKDELCTLYQFHEIAIHTVTHPFLSQQPKEQILWEFLEDRHILEEASGRIIRGMSYPFGVYNSQVIRIAREVGIVYGRTVQSHHQYGLPEDWFLWHPTCHDRNATLEKAKEFLQPVKKGHSKLMYIWGHSYEFEQQKRWNSFRDFCRLIGDHRDRIWRATNIEIYEYVQATRQLIFNVNRTMVSNPTYLTIWIRVDEKVYSIPPGTIEMKI